MSSAAEIFCKGLIDQLPLDTQKDLFSLMPPLEAIPSPSMEQAGDFLSGIHPSWMAPYLRTLTENDARLFLAAIDSGAQQHLKKDLGLRNHLPKISSWARDYLRHELAEALTHGKSVLPKELLPPHPLLNLSSVQLKNMVQFLGLHDLSFEMRKIIATKELKKIFHSLSQGEGNYLKKLMLKAEPLIFKRLFLQGWKGDQKGLTLRLQERGAARLGAFLHGEDSSLIWQVTHSLEMNLASVVLKHCAPIEHPRAKELLQKQINGILEQVKETL